MALKRVYKVGVVILGFLLIFGVIGWYYVYYRPRLYYKTRERIVTGEPYPYLSARGSNTPEDDPWVMKNFQPVVKDFLRKDGANYIIGEYEDGIGNVYKAKIFISGKIDEENYIESVYYYQSEDNQGLWSFDRLKQEVKTGSRIRVEYLSDFPDEELWNCEEDLILCQLAKVEKDSFEKLKKYEEKNIGSMDIVFGGLVVYSEIYEN